MTTTINMQAPRPTNPLYLREEIARKNAQLRELKEQIEAHQRDLDAINENLFLEDLSALCNKYKVRLIGSGDRDGDVTLWVERTDHEVTAATVLEVNK